MNRPTRLTTLGGMLAVAVSLSCADAGHVLAPAEQATVPAPAAGRLVVSLNGVGAGAVLLVLRGNGIEAPTAADSSWNMFTRSVDSTGTAYRIAIMGDRIEGALFSFAVADVNRPSAYTVTLMQVSDESNKLLESLEGYTLSVAPKKDNR